MKSLVNQIVKFIGISGIGWILDFFVFNCLTFVVEKVSIANMISSLVGVSFVFCVSTKNTFKQREGGFPIKWKFFFYIIYQIILIILISYLLEFLKVGLENFLMKTVLVKFVAVMAKILVTPITMSLNFVVMKFLIEKM